MSEEQSNPQWEPDLRRRLTEARAALSAALSSGEPREPSWAERWSVTLGLAKLAGFVAVFLGLAFALDRGPIARWLDRVLTPVPWWLKLPFEGLAFLLYGAGVLVTIGPLIYLPWIAAFKLEEPSEQRDAWKMAFAWAMMILVCIFVLALKWPQ